MAQSFEETYREITGYTHLRGDSQQSICAQIWRIAFEAGRQKGREEAQQEIKTEVKPLCYCCQSVLTITRDFLICHDCKMVFPRKR